MIVKLLLITIIVLGMLSCDIQGTLDDAYSDVYNAYYETFQCASEFYYEQLCEYDIPCMGFKTVKDVFDWVASNITYHQESGNEWQTPEETFYSRRGDCEDFALLVLYFLREELHYSYDDLHVMLGYGVINHAWVSIEGLWYEPQSGKYSPHYTDKYDEIFQYSYTDAMLMAHIM